MQANSKNVQWVTVKGKHLPLSAVKDYKKDSKTSADSTKTTVSGSGSAKKSLSKKDELKNYKGNKK